MSSKQNGNAEASSSKQKKARTSISGTEKPIKKDATKTEPRPAPAFVSTLKQEETDFPRGGGTTLTALEVKQARDEGRREAMAESQAESSKTVKRKKPMSERQAKRMKKNEVGERKEQDKDLIRIEHLNYKRLVTGTKVFARVHTILPLHLILSLPNNLLAHVPITEISNTLTDLLRAEEEDSEGSDDGSDSSSAPDLLTLFQPGQYVLAKVLTLYPTASQSFISQYPVSETNRLAARVELSLMPEKVNSEIAKADVGVGYQITGEVLSEEDKGWRVGLGLNADNGLAGVEGWIKREKTSQDGSAANFLPGQLVSGVITSTAAGGRLAHLAVDQESSAATQIGEVSNVGSLLPGHLVSGLITAVEPSGLNVKICGFFDGTIDLSHLGLGESDIEEKYKIGRKVKARIIYDNLTTTPRRFALSVLPHILDLTSPLAPGTRDPIEQSIEIGRIFSSVQVDRVLHDWGLMCRTQTGLEGFAHISHLSDEHLPALTHHTKQFGVGTVHRARVIGHSPFDGVLLLSLEQKVLDQVFMQVDELQVGKVLKGTIRALTDKALFVNLQGSVDGVVYPIHYADIQIKHPEKRFKVGNAVRCRVFSLDAARSRVILTLKKSLVDSELDITTDIDTLQTGQVTPAVVSKLLAKGCVVDLFGGLRAFVPLSEASPTFVANLNEIFFVGKPVNVRITEVDPSAQKIIASVRQALPSALAAEKLSVGDSVNGIVAQVHSEQVVVTLVPSQLTALLSLSTLANHRHLGVDELRESLKVGEKLEDMVVVSKNAKSGLLVVSTKKAGMVPSGFSRSIVSFESLTPGEIVSGRVISHTPQGTMILLPNNLRGRVHPCDVTDDYSALTAEGGPLKVDEEVKTFVLKVNPSTRIIDLSTRQSRVDPENAPEIVDREITSVDDVKEDMPVRGLVKSVTKHGLFVSIGRSVTARVMIKELFDEYVKDWQSQFALDQLVSGKILSVDHRRNFVEMTLRKNPSAKSKKTAQLGLSDFQLGQKVIAVVKSVEAYGMFLKIEGSAVSGLCHKSEISDDKDKDVSRALKGFRAGDQVKAMIVSLDREKGKVNFGIKASYFDEDFKGIESTSVQVDEEDEEQEGDVLMLDGDSDEDDGDEAEEDGSDEEEDEENVEDHEDNDEAEGDEEDENEGRNDEDEDEDEIQLDMSAPSTKTAPAKPSQTKLRSQATSAPTLNISGGFEWSGRDSSPAPSAASESDSDDEADNAETSRPKGKGKSRAVDLTATAPDAQPSSSAEFERSLLSSPNSSFLWIQYMSFHLQLHEIDQARKIGRKALEKMNYREEEEKLNVWMALVNLEIGFGTEETMEKVFKEAAQYNDSRTVYMRYAEALQAAGKEEVAEEAYNKLVKKFSAYPDSWTKFAEFYLKKGDIDSARALLPRSLKSLDKSKHVETTEKIAVLEFKHGDAERGKTLFEGILDRYPKRLDVWSVYIDQVAKAGDVQGCRGLFERLLQRKHTAKRAKFLFKKWLNIETRIGDKAGQEKAKQRAREWVMANAKPQEEEDVPEGEEEEEGSEDEE